MSGLQPRMPDAPHLVNLLATPKRVRAFLGDVLVADSRSVLTLRANHFLPVYYFPSADVNAACLAASSETVRQPSLGAARRVWNVVTPSERRTAAAWSYDVPEDPALRGLAGYVALDFKPLSRWFEEGEEVFVHPRDPYARIEVLDGDCRIEVTLDGALLADSSRPRLLIEPHLPVRHYLPPEDVAMSRLSPSSLRTRCPYKGEASYWNATIDGRVHENIAWSYADPVPEMSRIAGLICFYADRVDAVRRDGMRLSPFGI